MVEPNSSESASPADSPSSASNDILNQEMMAEITRNKIKENAQQLRATFLERMDLNLNELVEDFVNDLSLMELSSKEKNLNNNKIYQRRKSRIKGVLMDKEFHSRQSLLTELFEVSHISTIHNIFIAILMLVFLNGFIYDILDNKGVKWDLGMIYYNFGKFDYVVWIWVMMKLSTVAILYPGFEYWAWNRIPRKNLMDSIFLILYVLYIVAMFVLPLRKLISEDLPPGSSNIILCEQIRLIMKSHAFVRENIPRALKYKPHQDNDENDNPCPEFSKFLYFLFVPTLVYRDNYPRTNKVRWRYVMMNFLQVFGCIVYLFFIFQRFCIPAFRKFGQEPMTLKSFVLVIFSCMLPGFLIFLSAFFAILHCWMNAFAEMLRFGDRMFYKDWWNSKTFSNYYRTWNVVVHDWLYKYVYKDFCMITGANKRLAPLFIVFLISSVVHEYIVTFTFHFFFPILFVLFQGFGVWLVFVTKSAKSKIWNIFFWMSLIAGTGILLALYSIEWYAHINCPSSGGFLWNTFVPRFITCENFLAPDH